MAKKNDVEAPPPASNIPHTPLVVGIGASAGGLQAFQDFLAHVPHDSGMAFVLVQHLDPEHDSMLVELLGRGTALSVVTAEDGAKLAADQVYVIPPDATLTVAAACLRVVAPAPARGQRRPVNTFFESLAVDQGDNAVGIVLSGTGNDGSRGVEAIKRHGGLVLAQSRHDLDDEAMAGMPRSAVETGCVDHVLPVTEMPRALIDHRRHTMAAIEPEDGDEMRSDAEQDDVTHLAEITRLLREHRGHDFSEYKNNTLLRRVQRRMDVRQTEALSDYIEQLRAESDERDALFDEMLIQVTGFFRDPAAWDALAGNVLPRLIANKGADDSIRIWIAGCASGEEAYSMAILVQEALGASGDAPLIQIFATDLGDDAIAHARTGWFERSMTGGLSSDRLERWFKEARGGYHTGKRIRDNCIFSRHDLDRDPPFSHLDLIVCRNLLIYMEPSLQDRILRKFHYGLKPGGYLFLGLSESVARSGQMFATVDTKQRLFQRRGGNLPAYTDLSRPAPRDTRANESDQRTSAPRVDAIDRVVRQVIEPYCPAYLVIDGKYEIQRFSGGSARHFLEPAHGAASLQLFDIVRKALRPAVRSAVQQAFSERRTAVADTRTLRVDGQQRSIAVVADYIAASRAHGALCLVIFRDADTAGEAGREPRSEQGAAALEQELRVTQTQLQAANAEIDTTHEQAKSAAEEYQSVNEELQSSNEELETSKEEMQSVNEELQTVNTELASTNELLTRSNSDLQNLLESTQIATIFLDKKLGIKSFTPSVTELFHLRDSDQGRPITDIANRLQYDGLERDIATVLSELNVVKREVELDDGNAFIMHIRLYRTVTDVIDGVVVTFFSITDRKRFEAQRAWLAAIVDSSHDAIISQDRAGAITSWNAAAERIFGYAADAAIGQSLPELLGYSPAGNAPDRLERWIEEASDSANVIRVSKNGRETDVALKVSPVADDQGEIIATSVIARDVSEHVAQENHRTLLVHELSHRVKNTLATVQSIMTQTLTHTSSLDAFREAFAERIQALAQTHTLLSRSEWQSVALRDLVETVLRPYGDHDNPPWRIRGTRVRLAAPKTLALSMALHELATNAAKYGALSVAAGRIEVAWERVETEQQTTIRLRWSEHGGPSVEAPSERGFGLSLIEDGLAHELEAEVVVDFEPEGLRCDINMPLGVLTSEASNESTG